VVCASVPAKLSACRRLEVVQPGRHRVLRLRIVGINEAAQLGVNQHCPV
jgi:hypothetical protein